MGFCRNFRFVCATRVVLIAATALILAQMFHAGNFVTVTVLGALLVYQAIALTRYVEHSNRRLREFLQSIEFSDFSQGHGCQPRGKTFEELRDAFKRVTDRFREDALKREEDLRYLLGIVQQVGIGLLVYEANGSVALVNAEGKKLLGVSALRNISDLEQTQPEFTGHLSALKPGERTLASLYVGDEVRQVALQTCEFRRADGVFLLLSLQNIGPELNDKELEAWQNLIRVLTHEVKNSLTPIQSLAASVEELLFRGDGVDSRHPPHEVAESLRIIRRRSEGLLRFVDAYRDLTHLPKPQYQQCVVGDLLSRVMALVAPRLNDGEVSLRYHVDPPDMTLAADPRMLEQALINLAVNAIDAVEGEQNPEVRIEAEVDGTARAVVRVIDNGCGIVRESLERIFIPFYSTKKTGSGIGLSLSRQVMRLHGGDLTVQSTPGEPTVFTMRF
jgi:signal transduction histidine kinase